MPIDKYGHTGPDPLFPSAVWNGTQWDMVATGLNGLYPRTDMMRLSGHIFNNPDLSNSQRLATWNYYQWSAEETKDYDKNKR